MSYEEPQFVEINLDAEVGSYQDDFSDVPELSANREPRKTDDPANDDSQ